MNNVHFTQEQLAKVARLSDEDMALIESCRRPHNKLGFAYQLGFVRLFNRFPTQVPFELVGDLVSYVSLQLDIDSHRIEAYSKRQATVAQHRQRILHYLGLRSFHEEGGSQLEEYLYQEALQIEPTDSLLVKAVTFLKTNHTLNPAEDTLRRLLYDQRKKARRYIFARLDAQLPTPLKERLDLLLALAAGRRTPDELLQRFPQETLRAQMQAAEALLANKYSNSLNVVTDRLNHLRKFVRPLLEKLTFETTDTGDTALQTALDLLTDTP